MKREPRIKVGITRERERDSALPYINEAKKTFIDNTISLKA